MKTCNVKGRQGKTKKVFKRLFCCVKRRKKKKSRGSGAADTTGIESMMMRISQGSGRGVMFCGFKGEEKERIRMSNQLRGGKEYSMNSGERDWAACRRKKTHKLRVRSL